MPDLSHYLRPRARNTAMLLLFSAVLCTLAGWLGERAYQYSQRAEMLAQQAERLRAAAVAPPAPQPSRAEQDTQKRWAALRAERAFNWGPVFAAVERAASEDIELLGFQPEKASRRVTLRGEGRDAAAVIDFLHRLAAQRGLKEVHLTQQKVTTRGRLTTVAFEIKAAIV